MINKTHYDVISFIKTIEGSHVFHEHRTLESALSCLVDTFNNEITTIINNKESRAKIGEYAQFAERLYRTENFILNNRNIEDIQDSDMRGLCEYLNLLIERCNHSLSNNPKNNSVLKIGSFKIQKRKLFNEINYFSNKLDEIDSFELLLDDKFSMYNDRYSKILSRLIFIKYNLAEVPQNIDNIIENKSILLSMEAPKQYITKGLYKYEKFLLEKNIKFKYNATEEFKNELHCIVSKDDHKKNINKELENKKKSIYALFSFKNDDTVYSF